MAAKSDHKRHRSKHKIDRRLGVNLWGRAKSPVNNREYGPGRQGRRSKPTDFGVQLMAKQKLKGYYGNIGEKQFKKYYKEAVRRRGDTGQPIGILECRLDALVIAEIRPYRFCRAPAGQPWPCQGQRSALQHPVTDDTIGDTIEFKESPVAFLL